MSANNDYRVWAEWLGETEKQSVLVQAPNELKAAQAWGKINIARLTENDTAILVREIYPKLSNGAHKIMVRIQPARVYASYES